MTSGWSDIGRRRRWRCCGCLATAFWSLSLLNFCAAAQEPTAIPSQTIRLNVDRVNVGIIVTDAKGKFVEGLQRENFQVLDNGAPQPIAEFASVETPAQVLLLMEAGPAVYLLQDAHLFVANSLLDGLSAGDRVAVARYTDAPAPILDFTTDKRAAQAALDQVQFNLGYGDLNLSASLGTILDWLAPIPGKNTIVLVSTGVDTSPQSAMKSTLSRLQTTDVQILAVSVSGPLRNGKAGSKRQIQKAQQEFEQADAWLATLAEATGGRAYFPQNAKALQEIYKQVAEIVRHEYSLAFAPPVADGAIHSIDVKVEPDANGAKSKEPGYRVDHRKAYVAPKPAP